MVALRQPPPASADIATWIYHFRVFLDLTQTQFADLMRVTISTVQKWEYGQNTPTGPALGLLERLAEDHDYPPPPPVDVGRGPVIRKET